MKALSASASDMALIKKKYARDAPPKLLLFCDDVMPPPLR